jgi:hypothetical protein
MQEINIFNNVTIEKTENIYWEYRRGRGGCIHIYKSYGTTELKKQSCQVKTGEVATLNVVILDVSVVLLLVSMFTAMAAYYWLSDPHTSMVSFTESLMNHPFFAIASIVLGKCFGKFTHFSFYAHHLFV